MYKLLSAAVRGVLSVRGCRRVCVSASGSGRGSNRRLHHHAATTTRTAARLYSSRRAERAGRVERRPLDRTHPSLSIVDPNQEEQFVFLDLVEPEEASQEEAVLQQLQVKLLPSAPPEEERSSPRSHLEKQQRALERQLKVLSSASRAARQEAEPDSLIRFHDTDFPLDESILTATKRRTKKTGQGQQKVYGTPDVDEPVSDTCCSGCGAVLHCAAADVAGYLPSEKYKVLLQENRLSTSTCQRCHLLTHHHKALNIKMSKEEYRSVVRGIKSQKALVLLIVDLLDVPDSIVPDLLELVGTNKHVVVLGNKIDLLPGDAPNYLQRLKRQLSQYCADAGVRHDIRDVHLISAKTGYGVESLISSLQSSWGYKGDVYLVGTANAGKSTLFNALLESDYCKSKATDVIHKATISPWPGTTLNLLKFPIINPTPERMLRRADRLKDAARQTEGELSPDELKRLQHFSKQGYLVGRVGRTFRADAGSRGHVIQFDPDSLAYGAYGAEEEPREASSRSTETGFTHNELKDARWLIDTPGIMKEHDVLSLLNEQEVRLLVPTQAIVPRTFVLKPSMSLFLGALWRIDFLQGEKSCWFTVIASSRLPVHITSLEKADAIYQKHAGHTLLGVPLGGAERMKEFPALVPQEFGLEGEGHLQAAADIKLSSAGWIAVTAVQGDRLVLRVHGPEAAGVCLRKSPLLPHVVALKGERVRKTPAYKAVKPPALLDGSLSPRGAERLKVKTKKTKTKEK